MASLSICYVARAFYMYMVYKYAIIILFHFKNFRFQISSHGINIVLCKWICLYQNYIEYICHLNASYLNLLSKYMIISLLHLKKFDLKYQVMKSIIIYGLAYR